MKPSTRLILLVAGLFSFIPITINNSSLSILIGAVIVWIGIEVANYNDINTTQNAITKEMQKDYSLGKDGVK